MEKTFLYIDILGFKNLVTSNTDKVESIFKIIDSLHVHKDIAFQTIVFSDTILVFNKDNRYPLHFYVTYLIEYAQQLFYRLSMINVYFKGIITLKPFTYLELKNVNAYYGEALISTYQDEKELKGFGLYIDKSISNDAFIFEKIDFNEKYDYILLCQSLIKLYKKSPASPRAAARSGCHNVDQRLSWIVLPPITSSPSQSKPDGFASSLLEGASGAPGHFAL